MKVTFGEGETLERRQHSYVMRKPEEETGNTLALHQRRWCRNISVSAPQLDITCAFVVSLHFPMVLGEKTRMF